MSGPKAEVDSLQFLQTARVELGNLYETYQRTVSIEPPGGALELSREQVLVNIPVSEFTEKALEVEVRMAGLPDSLVATVLPKTVTLRCNVSLDSYMSLEPEDFHMVCHYSEYAPDDRYLVELDSVPKGVFAVEIQPAYVGAVISSRY